MFSIDIKEEKKVLQKRKESMHGQHGIFNYIQTTFSFIEIVLKRIQCVQLYCYFEVEYPLNIIDLGGLLIDRVDDTVLKFVTHREVPMNYFL